MRRILTAILTATLMVGTAPLQALAGTDQTITFTTPPPADAVVGGPAYTPAATATSGLTVTFTVDATSAGACSIDAGEVTFQHVGTCVVDADQAGDDTWNAAPQVQQGFDVGQGSQTVSITSAAPASPVTGDSYAVSATATSGLAAAITIDPGTAAACSVAGDLVSFDHAGTCTVDADQAGDADWLPAAQDQQTIEVGQAPQTISFTSADPTPVSIGDHYTPTANATSGLPVQFSIDAAAAAVCAIDGSDVVTFNAVGSCVIDAAQGGDADWQPAPTVQLAIGVGDRKPVCTPASPVDVVMSVASTGDASCADADLQPLTYAIGTDGTLGHATIDSTGTWTYTSDPGVVPPDQTSVTDSFTVIANDGLIDSDPATISVTIGNRPVAGSLQIQHVPPIAPTAIDVLAQVSPGEGDAGQPLTITAVTQGATGRVATDGHTVSYDPTGCSTATDAFTFTASDGSTAVTVPVAVVVDKPGLNGQPKTPLTNTPSVGFSSGSRISSTVPLKIAWCGVTATSTRTYRVQQSSNGGSTFPSTLYTSTRGTSTTRSVAVSTSYQWRVRTTDSTGRYGAYARSLTSRITRYQDTATSIHYTSGWHTVKSSSYSGGSERYATSTAAKATLALPLGTRQFAVVGPRSSTRGSFRVYLDGVLVATVKERSSSTAYRVVLFVRSVTTSAPHTIVIRPYGNGRIDLDAILVLR